MAEGKKISEEVIEKKLMSFNNTQDSVQALSLWIMHNKSHHQKIVDTWLKVLRRGWYYWHPTHFVTIGSTLPSSQGLTHFPKAWG